MHKKQFMKEARKLGFHAKYSGKAKTFFLLPMPNNTLEPDARQKDVDKLLKMADKFEVVALKRRDDYKSEKAKKEK